MNKNLFIGLMIGSLTLVGSIVIYPSQINLQPFDYHINVLANSSAMNNDGLNNNGIKVADIKSEPFLVNEETSNNQFKLNTINRISLADNQYSVIEKLGQPPIIHKDETFEGVETYEYENMNIGFVDTQIDYIEVLNEAGTIEIDGTAVPISVDGMINLLGKPDYIGEDGLVFENHEAVIKIFIDETTNEIISVDYYHLSST